jgi:hypothetical protein
MVRDSREWSQVHFEAAGAGSIPNPSILALTSPQGDDDDEGRNVDARGPGTYRGGGGGGGEGGGGGGGRGGGKGGGGGGVCYVLDAKYAKIPGRGFN